jgi:hypothetical protein
MSELPISPVLTAKSEELYLHNNFGICQQMVYRATKNEAGLARVKATYVNHLG